MQAKPLEDGRSIMRSKEIEFHELSRIGKGYGKLHGQCQGHLTINMHHKQTDASTKLQSCGH